MACVAGAPAADAQTGVDHAWSSTGPLAPVAPTEDRIYVSQVAGQEQARAYVRVPQASAASLIGAEVVLKEAEGGIATDQAALRACAVSAPVQGSGKVAEPPPADCTVSSPFTRDDTGSWTVVLTPLSDAIGGAGGGWFAITPAPAETPTTFTVPFDTTATVATLGATDDGAEADTFGGPEPEAAPQFDVTAPTPAPGIVGAPSLELGDGPLLSDPNAAVPPSQRARPGEATGAPAPRVPLLPRNLGDAASPPAVVLLLVAAVVGALLFARGRWLPAPSARDTTVQRSTVMSGGVTVVLLALVLLLSEAAVYKLGFVGIVFIAAIGLHLLVNWSGEVSLAHASFVGLPAFMVAQLADRTGWTPIVFLPVGVLVGALLGLLVAIPARRARGLQVALVTLAVGIAITQFLFVRTWVIGPPSGLQIPVPSLFGLRFETSRSLLPVLVAVIGIAVLAARAILSSTIGRALSQVRLVPNAAATAGVPVAAYRGAAYAFAGAFAGLAGGAYVLWVQRVGPQAFPLNLGFTYLVIATLAGKGGLLGVALAALMLEGGRLFSIIPESIGLYLGPIALIYNVTRYQEGINGVLRQAGRQLRARKVDTMDERTETTPRAPARTAVRAGTTVRLPVVIAGVIIAVGLGAIALAWYHAGNTDQLWIQNQEMLSGGFGGGALVILGSALLIRDALLEGRGVVGSSATPPPPED